MRCAACPIELADARAQLRKFYPGLSPFTSITVYETAPTVLAAFDESLQAYAQRRFAREGIVIHTGMRVHAVHEDSIEVGERGRVPSGMTVWSTGLAPNPLIESISELRKDEKTKALVIDGQLHPLDAKSGEPVKHVWAMGDCAVLETGRLPATAQVASQQGKYAARALNLLAKDLDEPSKPFEFSNRGSLAYIGSWQAIYDFGRKGDSSKNPTASGTAAWLLWRTTVRSGPVLSRADRLNQYFSMSSVRNMVLVPVFWFMTCVRPGGGHRR